MKEVPCLLTEATICGTGWGIEWTGDGKLSLAVELECRGEAPAVFWLWYYKQDWVLVGVLEQGKS